MSRFLEALSSMGAAKATALPAPTLPAPSLSDRGRAALRDWFETGQGKAILDARVNEAFSRMLPDHVDQVATTHRALLALSSDLKSAVNSFTNTLHNRVTATQEEDDSETEADDDEEMLRFFSAPDVSTADEGLHIQTAVVEGEHAPPTPLAAPRHATFLGRRARFEDDTDALPAFTDSLYTTPNFSPARPAAQRPPPPRFVRSKTASSTSGTM